MEVVHPSARDAFRRQQIRSIKREIRRKYAGRIRAASTKAEKKRLKAERDAEIAARTGPLVREGQPFYPPGHCQACGYNLTGNTSGAYPECGQAVYQALAKTA